jgi:hypothetical protein
MIFKVKFISGVNFGIKLFLNLLIFPIVICFLLNKNLISEYNQNVSAPLLVFIAASEVHSIYILMHFGIKFLTSFIEVDIYIGVSSNVNYVMYVPVVWEQKTSTSQHHSQISLAQIVDRRRRQWTDVAAFAQGYITPAQVLVHFNARSGNIAHPHIWYTLYYTLDSTRIRIVGVSTNLSDYHIFHTYIISIIFNIIIS